MSKSIWVIEEGSYSDYDVVGVFSSKKNAEVVMKALSGRDYGDGPAITEWQLDPDVEELNAGLTLWTVWMLRDGTTERCEQCHYYSPYGNGQLDIWRRSTAPAYRKKGVQDCLSGSVWAKDAEHAIKIANEKRTELIALNKW